YASMWDAEFVEEDRESWPRLHEVLLGHCQAVGRDPGEISCSCHLRLGPDPDPAEVAHRCANMFEMGLDVVILGLTSAHDGATVEALATALVEVD
ncbi:MAG: LLM class F420-dependent oxidoreductase, partial [Acidimicrobiia bacterium]